jgi:hypothetical protein
MAAAPMNTVIINIISTSVKPRRLPNALFSPCMIAPDPLLTH